MESEEDASRDGDPGDSRNVRVDTPQYQYESDRLAAGSGS
jgi:hypothetical protein